MSITKESELAGMERVGEVVAVTLREMRNAARPGMSTKQLDDLGAQILRDSGARPAPALAYGFPGATCISLNHEMAHGVPSGNRILREGDLVNIDVSAELGGYWADNGGSFVLGENPELERLVETSGRILHHAIRRIQGGVRMADIGMFIETEAKKSGYTVIRNLAGHGVGRGLHEEPGHIWNYRDRNDRRRFRKNTVIAMETFISTGSTLALELNDGWTLAGNKGGYTAQHEHTIVVTAGSPLILTGMNGIGKQGLRP